MIRLRALDVIRIHDDHIRPPGPKFIVCVEPDLGLFLRINSDGWRDGSVAISFAAHSAFLRHNSYIECGELLEPDSYIIGQALADGGIWGRIDAGVAPEIRDAIMRSGSLARRDRIAICRALGFTA